MFAVVQNVVRASSIATSDDAVPESAQTHYERHHPEATVLYRIVQKSLETFLAQIDMETGQSLTEFVTKNLITICNAKY